MNNSIDVIVVDYGSQTTQLILRRIREIGIYCEIISFNNIYSSIKKIKPKAIILSGGPASAFDNKSPKLDRKILELGIPILGICYGMQLICQSFNSKIKESKIKEFGKAKIKILKNNILFSGLDIKKKHQVWMSHGDEVAILDRQFEVIASSNGVNVTAVAFNNKPIFGLQFHPEVVHTIIGTKLIKNFILKVAKIKARWKIENFLENKIIKLRKEIGNCKVVCGLSGGVDSSVAAALLDKAIGRNLVCIFVDHGLLRKNESKEVIVNFKKYSSGRLIHIKAKKIFLEKLKGVSSPERKRKIIGREFIRIFEKEAKKIKGARYLAQGTLYPDVIESKKIKGSKNKLIKSHHNVGGLPKRLKLKLVEPFRELFKDEVRKIGIKLNVPKQIVFRHPFPGPGLAIRIPGEVSNQKLEILKKADSIYIEELRKNNLYDKIWQAFCVLLPIKSVGVMGDSRSYEYTISVRAIKSMDGMTAEIFSFKLDFLKKLSGRIVGEVKGVNRVLLDITSKPPATIEWE